jgi:2,3-bisphosphoglycerate-dependent phosphoglycerate mutase
MTRKRAHTFESTAEGKHMELYIIRHGQSTNNALEDNQQRSYDPELTELGKEQAAALATYLERTVETNHARHTIGQHINWLYCSPMCRALQTAAPISRALGIDPEIHTGIHEHGGIYLDHENGSVGYSGMTRSEMLARFPNYALPDHITEAGWWTGAKESYIACQSRAADFARQLHEWATGQHKDDTVAIITHGTFIDCLLKALLHGTHVDHCHYRHHNTAVTRVAFVRENYLYVYFMNRLDHLSPDQIT